MTRRVLYHCATIGAHSSRLYVSAFNLSLNISSRDPGSRRSVGSRNNIKATHEQASVWRRNIGSDDNIPKETSSNARHQSQMQDTNLKRLSIKFAVDRRSATDTVWDCRSESYKPFLSSKASTIIYASGTVINKFYICLAKVCHNIKVRRSRNRTKPGVNGIPWLLDYESCARPLCHNSCLAHGVYYGLKRVIFQHKSLFNFF